jgi:hypothetical protein
MHTTGIRATRLVHSPDDARSFMYHSRLAGTFSKFLKARIVEVSLRLTIGDSTKMRVPFRKLAKTTWGSHVVTFLLPFMARPSEFTGRKLHRLYCRVSGVPLAPLFPAGLFAQAFSMNASTIAEHYEWQRLDVHEAIKQSQMMISESHWTAFGLTYVCIELIAVSRWGWHFLMGKLCDRWRTDGQKAKIAPLQFFTFQTSGLASWFAVYIVALFFVQKFAYGSLFTTVAGFFNSRPLWGAAVLSMFLLFTVKFCQNNTEVLTEIYGSQQIVEKVGMIGYFALFSSIVLYFWISILALKMLVRFGTTLLPSDTGAAP